MNARVVSVLLLVAMLGLLVSVGYVAWRLRSEPEVRPVRVTTVVTNTVTQIAVRKINATNLLASLGSRPLSWASLESTNYRTYIANLRAFGCPEETIKDIILTDVSRMYARRRAALRELFQPAPYWRTDSDGEGGIELQKQLFELDREQRALVRELLGVDYRTEMSRYWQESGETTGMMDFLPEAKREQVRLVNEKFEDLIHEVHLQARGLMLEEDEKALRKLRQQREAELAAILTPEEMEEYALRHSETAQSLRARLNGFDATEEEFRELFRRQRVFDEQFASVPDALSEVEASRRVRAQEEAQAALDEEIRKVLGPERYAQWERVQDPDYRTLLQYANRFDLPRETVARAYDAKRQAELYRQALDANPNLTDEQRAAAVRALVRETEAELDRILGRKAGRNYRRSAGWLQALSELPAPANANP